MSDVDSEHAEPTVSIKDKASGVLDAIEAKLDGLKNAAVTWQLVADCQLVRLWVAGKALCPKMPMFLQLQKSAKKTLLE